MELWCKFGQGSAGAQCNALSGCRFPSVPVGTHSTEGDLSSGLWPFPRQNFSAVQAEQWHARRRYTENGTKVHKTFRNVVIEHFSEMSHVVLLGNIQDECNTFQVDWKKRREKSCSERLNKKLLS